MSAMHAFSMPHGRRHFKTISKHTGFISKNEMRVGFGGCCFSFEFDLLNPRRALSLHRRTARTIFAFRHRMLFLCVMKAVISKPLNKPEVL